MIDCITIEHDQLERAGQLEDALDLLLHLAEAVAPAGGSLHDGPLRGIVHDGAGLLGSGVQQRSQLQGSGEGPRVGAGEGSRVGERAGTRLG